MAIAEHYLKTVALRAGLSEADELTITANTPIGEAWKRAMATLGKDEEELVALVADHYMTSRADFAEPSQSAQRLIPAKVARIYHVFPLRENDREIYVATADPTDEEVQQALRYASGRTPVFRIATPWRVEEAIQNFYASAGPVARVMSRVATPEEEPVHVEASSPAEVASAAAEETPVAAAGDAAAPATPESTGANEAATTEAEPATPPRAAPRQTAADPAAVARAGEEERAVARLAARVLADAIRDGATRVILEASDGGNGVIRFRTDGVERRHMTLSVAAMNRVIARLAKLAGATKGPDGLTGAARVRMDERTYAFHIAVGQMAGAYRAFLRIQDPTWRPGLGDLSLPERELESLRELLQARSGLVLVAGPEGSGRSTLTRAILRELVASGRRPASVEERVLGEVNGVTHIQATGEACAAAVAGVSRGRDALVVDEVRGQDALQAVVREARDRLVVAVVEGADAAGALHGAAERLGNLEGLAAVVRGAVALRQVRRLCAACAAPAGVLDPAEAARADAFAVRPARKAVGCPQCAGTGYRGALPVVAVLPVQERVRTLLGQGASVDDLRRSGRSVGHRPLLQVGLARAAAGETTLAEIERVVSLTPVAAARPRTAPLVLVVDDDAETRVLARSVLESAGYRVDEAEDGAAALDRLVTGEDCALVVLDLFMPGMDGHDVLHRIKSDVLTAGVNVLVLTGSENPEDERRAMAEGAEDYVRKPLEPARFLARVAAALHRKEAALEDAE